jgi:4-amino-4-deoxy-L-arabinose transferase-like glycosyltransferase
MAFLKQHWILIALTLLGSFFFFYNLAWGAPYFFHPDERNVASAVSQLQFPNQLNPNFFAYGSLPIYTVFLTGLLSNILTSSPLISQVSFEQAILIGRIYSALFATALIPILYYLAIKITRNKNIGLLVAFMAVTSVGFIQFAHFGTFEMWITFFSIVLFWICLKIIEKKKTLYVFLTGVTFGILFAIKISTLALLPAPLLAIIIAYRPYHLLFKEKNKDKLKNNKFHSIIIFLTQILLFGITSALIYFITNPFVLLDTEAFLSSIRYESSVGLNTLPVFYTQGFYDTTPILYQFMHVYPFLLNPLVTILLIPSLVFIIWKAWSIKNAQLFMLILFFMILFISQAILFIKWTRYMLPTLPFVFLLVATAIDAMNSPRFSLSNVWLKTIIGIIIFTNSIFALSYFTTAFVQPDTRMTALAYAKARIPENSLVLSEIYDIGITAFNPAFSNIVLFNTYDLNDGSPDFNETTWQTAINNADYIILPSQRVLQTRIQNPKRFPVGNEVYESLLNGNSGYEKIYETPCDIFCKITYLGDPVFRYEQTANVFERPTVYIFQKKQ